MDAKRWQALGGLAGGVLLLTACVGPVPVHETPGWNDSIAKVQAELAAIAPEPDETPGDSEDPTALLTMSSPNAVLTPWVDLLVGQCMLWPWDQEGYPVASVKVVPCDEPHFGEVFVTGESTMTTYSEVLLDVEVDEECELAYEEYVGVDYWDSEYYLSYTYPGEEHWNEGSRGWRCFVYEADHENTGSLRGAMR